MGVATRSRNRRARKVRAPRLFSEDERKVIAPWTPERDAQLAAAVALHGFDLLTRQGAPPYWHGVAKTMDLPNTLLAASARRCQRRWLFLRERERNEKRRAEAAKKREAPDATSAAIKLKPNSAIGKQLSKQLQCLLEEIDVAGLASEPPERFAFDDDELPPVIEPEPEPEPEPKPQRQVLVPVVVSSPRKLPTAPGTRLAFGYQFGIFNLQTPLPKWTYRDWRDIHSYKRRVMRSKQQKQIPKQSQELHELLPAGSDEPMIASRPPSPTYPPRMDPPLPPPMIPLEGPSPCQSPPPPPPPLEPRPPRAVRAPTPPLVQPPPPAPDPTASRLRIQGKVTDFMVITKGGRPVHPLHRRACRSLQAAFLLADDEPPLE